MFEPHSSEIEIDRREPDYARLSIVEKIFKNRMKRVASIAVTKDLLKTVKTVDEIERAKKLAKMDIQFSNKKDRCKEFIGIFNKWREYFAERPTPWKPKALAQLKQIDEIVYEVEAHGLDLDLFVACSFKAVEKWKINVPSFTVMLSKGMDFYYANYEDVLAQLDAENY